MAAKRFTKAMGMWIPAVWWSRVSYVPALVLAAMANGFDALAEGFQSAHPRLFTAAGVVSAPSLREFLAVVSLRTQGLASGLSCRTCRLLEACILADRESGGAVIRPGDGLPDERDGVAFNDGL